MNNWLPTLESTRNGYWSIPRSGGWQMRSQRNLDKRIEKASKSLKKLRAKEFAYEPDAQMAA